MKKEDLENQNGQVIISGTLFFLILQYNKVELTMNCVNSILKLRHQNSIGMAIVDNNSTDGAGQKIINSFLEDETILFLQKIENKNSVTYKFVSNNNCHIDVILRKKNDGFSKANNEGYRYILNNYDPEYLAVINNDVELRQENFLSLIEEEYGKSEFDILGPDIWNPLKQIHQNPIGVSIPRLSQVNKTILLNQIALILFPIAYPFINRFMSAIVLNSSLEYDKRAENICLQGACLIYSKKYMELRRGISLLNDSDLGGEESLFYPETHFYYEEFIQTLWCRRHGCKMVYTPAIQVNHMEGQSTDTISKDEKERIKFRMNNILKSAKIYRNQLRKLKVNKIGGRH